MEENGTPTTAELQRQGADLELEVRILRDDIKGLRWDLGILAAAIIIVGIAVIVS